MTQEQKQKFIEVSKLTKEKGLREGWVYVGNNGPMFFGMHLISTKGGSEWDYTHNDWCGSITGWAYACPVSVWEEKIGQKYSCRPVSQKLPTKFFIRTNTPALSTAVQGKLFEFGYCWRGGGQDVRHPEQKYLYIDKKSLHYSYNNQYNHEIELSLDTLFSLEPIKDLTISGILPDYEITVNESGLEAAGIKIDWVKWEEIRGFLNQKFDWRDPRFQEIRWVKGYNKDINKGIQSQLSKLGCVFSGGDGNTSIYDYSILKINPNKKMFASTDRTSGFEELTIEEIFKDCKKKVYFGPEFEKGSYTVFAREEGPSFGCKKLESWDKWRELEAKVEQFKLELK